MKALEQLATEIAQAHKLGFAPARWDELARTAMAEVDDAWETEKAFRVRTGASDKWCLRHFEQYVKEGTARRDEHGKRHWHRHARTTRKRGMERGAIRSQIVRSFSRERQAP